MPIRVINPLTNFYTSGALHILNKKCTEWKKGVNVVKILLYGQIVVHSKLLVLPGDDDLMAPESCQMCSISLRYVLYASQSSLRISSTLRFSKSMDHIAQNTFLCKYELFPVDIKA